MKKWLVILAAAAIGTSVFAEGDQAKGDEGSEESAVIVLTKDNFDATLKDNSVVLVDFWAPWCGPCRIQGPIVDEVAKDVEDGVAIGKVNVDENGELASKFGISSIPTLIVFKDGKVKEQLVGVHQKEDLVKLIDEAK